ncbi:selenophosphate synthetase [Campylobacter sputorum subsp. bovis]|nr:selenophosphate synthetase [Campylobacter sputorum]
MALVQTLDFITPVVDDPFIYGQIAAANSLSDIFAMGGEVINALNIMGFDSCNFEKSIMSEILQGGKSKINECGGVLVGGHSIETKEMYYGLSVTGKVNPKNFWSNSTAKIGDVLILTKPLGIGVLSTCIKADILNLKEIQEAISYMTQLNFYAISALKDIKVSACTDITGFGLLGHLFEMSRDDISFVLQKDNIPLMKSAIKYANMGFIPAGSYKNMEFVKTYIYSKDEVDILYFDAQTSGGLLLSIEQKDANKTLINLKNAGYEKSAIIGEVCEPKEQKIIIK